MLATLCRGKPPAAWLFDLDGTLVDSAPDLAAAVDRTLGDMGLPAAGEARVRLWIGNGATMLVRRALAYAQQCAEAAVEAALHERALKLFFEHYQRLCCGASQLYAGTREALEALQQSGAGLACVTNKPDRFTHQLLDYLAIGHLFGAVVSGDTLAVKKPDPAPLQLAADTLGSDLAACVMVGDSSTDIDAARNAGIAAVAVNYGYSRGRDVQQLGADWVIGDLRQLLA